MIVAAGMLGVGVTIAINLVTRTELAPAHKSDGHPNTGIVRIDSAKVQVNNAASNQQVWRVTPRIEISIVNSSGLDLKQYTIDTSTLGHRIELIDDQRLLAELTNCNQPAGIIYVKGEARLVFDSQSKMVFD